jgi:phage baseplate assembly protein gpV
MTNATTIGTITQVNEENKALVCVSIGDRESDWMPLMMMASPFKRHWTPIRVGEQVGVLGGLNSGFAIRGIFWDGVQEPTGANDTASNTVTIGGFNVTIAQNVRIDGVLSVASLLSDGNISSGGNITASGVMSDSDGNNGA